MIVLFAGTIGNTGFFGQVRATSDLGIIAVGDWGCTENTRDTVANIKNSSPDLVLALGDLLAKYCETDQINYKNQYRKP